MARKIYRGYARDGNGTVLSGATVSVYLTGTSTVASIYTASSGGTAVNSVDTDSTGLYSFYVDYSDYAAGTHFRLTISKTGYDSVTYDEVECLPPTFSTDGTLTDNSDADFPSEKAVKTYVDATVSAAAGGTLSGSLVLSGGQIAFPATANPSADANTLDDYEEGTWTPALYFGGYAVGITYAAGGQVGRYTKIGNRVFFDLHIALSANGSSSGQASVSLPIAAASGDTAVSIVADNMTFGGQLMAMIGGYTSFLKLWDLSEAGEMAYITEADIADNAYFFISGHYRT